MLGESFPEASLWRQFANTGEDVAVAEGGHPVETQTGIQLQGASSHARDSDAVEGVHQPSGHHRWRWAPDVVEKIFKYCLVIFMLKSLTQAKSTKCTMTADKSNFSEASWSALLTMWSICYKFWNYRYNDFGLIQ